MKTVCIPWVQLNSKLKRKWPLNANEINDWFEWNEKRSRHRYCMIVFTEASMFSTQYTDVDSERNICNNNRLRNCNNRFVYTKVIFIFEVKEFGLLLSTEHRTAPTTDNRQPTLVNSFRLKIIYNYRLSRMGILSFSNEKTKNQKYKRKKNVHFVCNSMDFFTGGRRSRIFFFFFLPRQFPFFSHKKLFWLFWEDATNKNGMRPRNE